MRGVGVGRGAILHGLAALGRGGIGRPGAAVSAVKSPILKPLILAEIRYFHKDRQASKTLEKTNKIRIFHSSLMPAWLSYGATGIAGAGC